MRRKILLGEKQIEVLQVPYYTQEQTETWCFPYSIKMCVEYFKEYYKYKVVRDKIKLLSTEEIAEILKSDRENGTRISNSILKQLEKETIMLNYNLQENKNFNTLENRFKNNLPTIVLYDLTYILNKERGPGHAAVVVGVTKDYIILNNPWMKGEWPIEKITFNQGWELEYHSIISIDPKPPIPSLEEVPDYQ
jgi:hypothetical protein